MPEVHVFLAEGRTDSQKKAMMRGITEALMSSLGIPSAVITVQIIEAKWTEKMKDGMTFTERYADRVPPSAGQPPKEKKQ